MRETDLVPASVKVFALCEYVHRHANSKQFSLIGVYHPCEPVVFGGRVECFQVFAELSDCQMETRLSVVIFDSGFTEEVLRFDVPLDPVSDPRDVRMFQCSITTTGFPKSGEYHVQLQADGNSIADRRLWIRLATDPSEGDADGHAE